jgi:hypothetical protein
MQRTSIRRCIIPFLTVAAIATWIATCPSPILGQNPGGGAAPFRSNGQTNLLFPYVQSAAGLDVEIAVSNTSADPLGTAQASGSCLFTFFSQGSTRTFATPTIAAGSTYTNTLSSMASGVNGYGFASCSFPLAHGTYTFRDTGATPKIYSSLPALNLPGTRTTSFAEQLLN